MANHLLTSKYFDMYYPKVLNSLFSLILFAVLMTLSSCCSIKYTDTCLHNDLYGDNGKYQFLDPNGITRRYPTTTDFLVYDIKENFHNYSDKMKESIPSYFDVKLGSSGLVELVIPKPKRPGSPPTCEILTEIWKPMATSYLLHDQTELFKILTINILGPGGVVDPPFCTGELNGKYEIKFPIPSEYTPGDYLYDIKMISLINNEEFQMKIPIRFM